MPFAPRIRKEILNALDDHIIPALWKQQVPLGYVAPPLQLPEGIEKRLLSSREPRADAKPPEFPIQSRWTKAKLHSTSYPYLGFIYEGMADERTLITGAQAAPHNMLKGIYALRWRAPGALLFSPGAPRNTGGKQHWEGPGHPPASKVLLLAFSDEILIHTYAESAAQSSEVSHSLQVKDASLLTLAGLFNDELRRHPAGRQEAAQALLLGLMLQLRDYLQSHPAIIANTARPSQSALTVVQPAGRSQSIYQSAANFIQMHLHEQLSVALIAREADISPTYLNNLFHRFSGVSVMRYVRQQRIAAAKLMLLEQPENIKEISLLLHFNSASAFCSVFRQHTGMTPRQFRRQAALRNH